jgi:hypothetical protein
LAPVQRGKSQRLDYGRALSLPAATLQALQRRGIYCTSGVTVEHQHHAKRYVLRGVESGGAVADMGRICAYLSPDGLPLPWLQSIDSLAVNGRHAIVLAQSLVRVEMLRMVRTCELSISLHALSVQAGRTRPETASKWLFRARDGLLPLELWRRSTGHCVANSRPSSTRVPESRWKCRYVLRR